MLHVSSLLRPTCIFIVSKPLIQLYGISRCPSLCTVPKLIEGSLPSSTFSLVDMGRRHRNLEVRAVLEAEVVTDNSQQGVNDEELLVKMWQGFGRTPVVPLLVKKLMQNTKALEKELGEELKFGGPRGSLKGQAGVTEDRRHRAIYRTLSDSEAKLQFFSARQVACRILGSHGYLCETCWLPTQDCMCEALVKGSLWKGVQLWVFMHPKDFLRKNNTGKLLWQALGDQVQLCVCGIELHEDAMWSAFQQGGIEFGVCIHQKMNRKSL